MQIRIAKTIVLFLLLTGVLVSCGSKKSASVSSNYKTGCNNKCEQCNHILLQADGKVVSSPCKKEY